jgi:hypothetical protein
MSSEKVVTEKAESLKTRNNYTHKKGFLKIANLFPSKLANTDSICE